MGYIRRGGVEMADIFENIIGVLDDGLFEERSVKGLNFEPDFHMEIINFIVCFLITLQ